MADELKIKQIKDWLEAKIKEMTEGMDEHRRQLSLYGNCFEVNGQVVDCGELTMVKDGGNCSYRYKGKIYSDGEVSCVNADTYGFTRLAYMQALGAVERIESGRDEDKAKPTCDTCIEWWKHDYDELVPVDNGKIQKVCVPCAEENYPEELKVWRDNNKGDDDG